MWFLEKGGSGMKDYQEALDRLENFAYHGGEKGNNVKIIQELVNEKLEQESRKDKLIVGSRWECVAKSLAPISARYIDPIFDKSTIAIQKSWVLTVLEIEKDYVKLQHENTKCFLSQDQFLLCFRPLKEGDKDEG